MFNDQQRCERKGLRRGHGSHCLIVVNAKDSEGDTALIVNAKDSEGDTALIV
jgi:hypothetical protein